MLTAEFSPANNAYVTLFRGPSPSGPSICPVGTEYRSIWPDLDELRFSMRCLGMKLNRVRRGLYEIVSGDDA